MNKSIEDIRRDLKRYNQEHLWDFYEKLEGKNKEKFLEQLERIDFGLIDSLYKNTAKEMRGPDVKVEPIDYWDKERLGGKYDFYEEIGKEAIAAGKLAAAVSMLRSAGLTRW